MSCRLASVALIFALAADTAIAADAAAVPASEVERMTPAQLRALQARLDRQSVATRGENAALRRRVAALEDRTAAHQARKDELNARLADVRARLASLKAARND